MQVIAFLIAINSLYDYLKFLQVLFTIFCSYTLIFLIKNSSVPLGLCLACCQERPHLFMFIWCSYERVFDHLVEDLMCKELAMRTTVRNAELLVFTSLELPVPQWSKSNMSVKSIKAFLVYLSTSLFQPYS